VACSTVNFNTHFHTTLKPRISILNDSYAFKHYCKPHDSLAVTKTLRITSDKLTNTVYVTSFRHVGSLWAGSWCVHSVI